MYKISDLSELNNCITLNFIRHGKTNYNVNNIIQGQENSILNIIGKKQAHNLKKFIKFNKNDLIICSDLKRCVETCNILCDSQEYCPEICYTELVRERHMGIYQGVKIDNILKSNDLLTEENIKNGESLENLYNRINKLLIFILNKVKIKSNINSIYIITHSTFLNHFYKNFFGHLPKNTPDNCSISTFKMNKFLIKNKPEISLINWNKKF